MRIIASVEGKHEGGLHMRVAQTKGVTELMGSHLEQVSAWKTHKTFILYIPFSTFFFFARKTHKTVKSYQHHFFWGAWIILEEYGVP